MRARARAQEDLNFDVKYGVNPASSHQKIANFRFLHAYTPPPF